MSLVNSFYSRYIFHLENYYFLQERKIAKIEKWAFLVDIRLARSILLSHEKDSFFFFLARGLSNLIKLLNIIFFLPRRVSKHPFHMVTPSPWPLYTSLACFSACSGFSAIYAFV